jgi:hypothetical protein
MRIVHGPLNVAGMASNLARAQRQLGRDSVSVCLPQGPFGYAPDRVLGQSGAANGASALSFLLTQLPRFDVLHFYYNTSFTGPGLHEISWLQAMGKKVFFTFLGCDVRDSKANLAQHKWSMCSECWPMGCSANRAALLAAATRADGVFVTTPDLLEFVPGARLLLLPYDETRIAPVAAPPPRRPMLRILHAPTDRQKKGTRHIEHAVSALTAAGAAIELEMIEGKSQSELFAAAETADLVIDQIMAGCYGTFAAEMMARGKPVIAAMRPDIAAAMPPHCPVIDANPDTIGAVLAAIVAGRYDLTAIGAASRVYATAHHASLAVAQALETTYRELGIAPSPAATAPT